MEVLILGGGVVGVTTAYQLLKDGHKVMVIDRLPPGIGGASYGNAGLIATGHSIAWGSPKALKIWFNSLFHQTYQLLFLNYFIQVFFRLKNKRQLFL